jgi:hypothetical protein
VDVIVRVLLVNNVHGQAKFVAVVGFSQGFNVGQQREYKLRCANDDALRGNSCHVRLQELHVYTDLLAKIEGVIDQLKKLFQHVACR